jgi:hypothetical protein
MPFFVRTDNGMVTYVKLDAGLSTLCMSIAAFKTTAQTRKVRDTFGEVLTRRSYSAEFSTVLLKFGVLRMEIRWDES